MINKIKCIIDKIKERYKYDMCYTKQEELGVAIFEMCNACNDKSCPYYTDTGKDYTDTVKGGIVMVTMTRAYTDEEITEATRLLLKMRDNCVRKDTDKYDDPLRKEKYNALNMAIDGLQYLPRVKGE